jgi:hypothetical protein
MRHPIRSIAALALGAASLCGAARTGAAQNLLSNPTFAQVLGLSPWETVSGSAAWDDFECGFQSPASGSAKITSAFATSAIRQCVVGHAGQHYRLESLAYVGPSVFGRAMIDLRFVDGTCEDSVVLDEAFADTDVQSEWVRLAVTATAPPGTDAVVVQLVTDAGIAVGNADGYFDNVYLPEPASAGTAAALAMLAALGRDTLRRRRWSA